jgi:hypothetical protein
MAGITWSPGRVSDCPAAAEVLKPQHFLVNAGAAAAATATGRAYCTRLAAGGLIEISRAAVCPCYPVLVPCMPLDTAMRKQDYQCCMQSPKAKVTVSDLRHAEPDN